MFALCSIASYPDRVVRSRMLKAHNLTARRGFTHLFTDLTFDVDRGDALLITGANGSGKTTLLRILAGLTAPAAGSVRWRGAEVSAFSGAVRQDVAFVGHLPALNDALTAQENLMMLLSLSGDPVRVDEVRAALSAVALDRQSSLPVRVLSQGQRRRVALARLALARRTLWLLDEPAMALDAAGETTLIDLITRHLAEHGCVVATTHQPLSLGPARVSTLALSP